MDWTQAADELRRIITGDAEVHAAWREGGVAAALRVVAAQRDEARAVVAMTKKALDDGNDDYGALLTLEQTILDLPWMASTPAAEKGDGDD